MVYVCYDNSLMNLSSSHLINNGNPVTTVIINVICFC